MMMMRVFQRVLLLRIFFSSILSVVTTNGFSSSSSYLPSSRSWSSARLRLPTTSILRATEQQQEQEQKSTVRTNHQAIRPLLDADELDKKLKRCKTARQANNVLREQLLVQHNSVGAAAAGDDDDSSTSTSNSLYGSISIPPGASSKGISEGDLAIQTRLTNKKYKIQDLIELSGNRDSDRASLAILCLTVASTMSAITANQSLDGILPEILRFVIVWVLSFAPLAFVGLGIATPEKLQALLVTIQREFFPAYRERMIQHEAGHLLMGHLLGWPIAGYRANAVKNAVEFYPLQDSEKGDDLARQLGFDSPTSSGRSDETSATSDIPQRVESFFSEQGRGAEVMQKQSVFREKPKDYRDDPFLKLASQNEPTKAWPYRGFDDETLDQLAVISVAGVCAEILAFGNAEGGLADLSQLRQIFASAEDKEIDDREADNRIRFALGYTMSQLRRHLGVLDAVADVMKQDGSVAECIVVMEECENISGNSGILGDYELRRRQEFRSNNKAGWIERIFLGDDEKTIDTDENRMVEGKGGGYRKESLLPRLTGDDPLYAALAAAFAFFVWASSGGLSLH